MGLCLDAADKEAYQYDSFLNHAHGSHTVPRPNRSDFCILGLFFSLVLYDYNRPHNVLLLLDVSQSPRVRTVATDRRNWT
jgi:hypothetical protein